MEMSCLQIWDQVNLFAYMVWGYFVRFLRKRSRVSSAISCQVIPPNNAKNPGKVRFGWPSGLADRDRLPIHPSLRCYNKFLLLDNPKTVHIERLD